MVCIISDWPLAPLSRQNYKVVTMLPAVGTAMAVSKGTKLLTSPWTYVVIAMGAAGLYAAWAIGREL